MTETRTARAVGPELVPSAVAFRVPPRRPAQKMSHVLAADLRRQILSGELAADQQLPSEAELTEAFRISRETLREALRILESQSLLEIRRGRGGGAVVRRPGLASVGRYVALLLHLRKTTLAHLEEARLVIEPPAAGQLAVRCGQEGIDHLAALHENARSAADDPLSFATAMATFDQAATDLSGNRSIAVIAGVLRDIYTSQVYQAVGTSDLTSAERVARRVIDSQSEFLHVARRREGDLASRAWSDYLTSTSRLLVSRSRSRQPIDVVQLWRAQVRHAGNGQPQRMATSVAAEIRSRIAEGRLENGDRLSSLTDLAKEFGISRPTLREALRILETERLIELRTGDRAGAQIQNPSTRTAAQLAGTVLEARQATLGDFYRAMRMIEPAMMRLVASRIDPGALNDLRALSSELSASTDDMPRFAAAWGSGGGVAFAATRNPALAVVAEILRWVRVGNQSMVTAAADEPWVATATRNAQLFAELVSTLVARDSSAAQSIWSSCLDVNAPFIESSELGRQRLTTLID